MQGTLADVLSEILNQEAHLLFASRTDRGVHATCNVALFTVKHLPFAAGKFADVLNEKLPRDLVVAESREVPRGFHPRYFCDRRDYVYRMYRGRRPDIRYARFTAHFPRPLDVSTMTMASAVMVGERDFSPLAVKDEDLQDPTCTVHSCAVMQRAKLLEIRVSANRFLRRMVCLMAGALVDVGTGRLTVSALSDALDGREHPQFTNMPSHGLTLVGVHYPEHLWFEGFAKDTPSGE